MSKLGSDGKPIYREDGKGNGSTNTGYFCSFRQGILDQGQFSITNPGSNQTVQLDATNVNDSDVWLYRLDNNGAESQLWTKVDAVEGNNVIYNRNNASSSYCIGMVKNGTIYNRNNASSSYKVGTTRDAERVISGRCSDAELGAIYILMKAGEL